MKDFPKAHICISNVANKICTLTFMFAPEKCVHIPTFFYADPPTSLRLQKKADEFSD